MNYLLVVQVFRRTPGGSILSRRQQDKAMHSAYLHYIFDLSTHTDRATTVNPSHADRASMVNPSHADRASMVNPSHTPDGQVKFPHPWPPQIPPGRTVGL
ncbi:hypothetical protein [Ottowia pentelensis]